MDSFVTVNPLDGVAGPDVLPMVGREVMERQQIGAVLGQTFDGPVIFHTCQASMKKPKAAWAAALVSGIRMSFRCALALAWIDFGMAFRTLAAL